MANNRVIWLNADDPPRFPDVESALRDPDGLLAAGGDLSSERLLSAYRSGIFPWSEEGQPVLWWSPDPRCVLYPDQFRVSRRLRQYLRRSELGLTFNRSFADVMRACAGERRSQQGTWITADMITSFEKLHAEGWAHSIEVRECGELVGGMYGIAIGRVFFGESMFSHADNASKFALLGLTRILSRNDFELLDCQVTSPHVLTLGAVQILRREFTAILRDACEENSQFAGWPGNVVPVRDLLPN